jgi:hypothetical protein
MLTDPQEDYRQMDFSLPPQERKEKSMISAVFFNRKENVPHIILYENSIKKGP